MSIYYCYDGLARLLDYPEAAEELTSCYALLDGALKERGIASPAASFGEMIRSSSLAELQEDYVAHFDFNPAVAPYLGHHLYGDNQKKGAYMIRVKKEYLRYGFDPQGCELPDHLAVLLGFLAHLARLGEDPVRRRFIEELVQPGVEKLLAALAPRRLSPWLTLIEAAGLLLRADCQEVSTC